MNKLRKMNEVVEVLNTSKSPDLRLISCKKTRVKACGCRRAENKAWDSLFYFGDV